MSNLVNMGFNARQVAPDAGQQDPVPAGWYKAAIVKSEIKPTKDTTGMRLEMQFKIIEGQFTNRMVFEGLNVQNTNPVAQEIAFKQLSAICHAVGKVDAQDTSELHNIPLQIKVSLKAATPQYEAKNEIKAYKHIGEVVAASPAAVVAPAAFGAGAPAAIPPSAMVPGQTWVPPAAVQPWAAAGAPATVQPVAQAPVPTVTDPVAAAQAVLAAAQAQAAAAGAAAGAAALAPPAWAAAPAAAPPAAAPPATVTPGAGITPPWATPAA